MHNTAAVKGSCHKGNTRYNNNLITHERKHGQQRSHLTTNNFSAHFRPLPPPPLCHRHNSFKPLRFRKKKRKSEESTTLSYNIPGTRAFGRGDGWWLLLPGREDNASFPFLSRQRPLCPTQPNPTQSRPAQAGTPLAFVSPFFSYRSVCLLPS